MTIPMHYIWTGLAIWSAIVLIAILFNHGAHRKTREERRIRMMEEANG